MGWDSTWERVFQEKDWGRYPAESLIRFIARNFYPRPRNEINILEIGCGTGANVWYLAREGFCVYGVDASETAVKKAKEFLRRDNLKADFKVGDAVMLPYPDSFFDAVIDVECLSCNTFADAQKIIKETKRVLKEGGLLYSRTFSDNIYRGKEFKRVGDMEYRDISDGPLAGIGLVRLIDRDNIYKLYGSELDIVSVDRLDYTENNGTYAVSEWIIICRK